MTDSNQIPSTPDSNELDFQKKPVETPILDRQSRQQMAISGPAGDGFKGFYRSNKYYFWAIALGVAIIAVLSFLAFRKGPSPAAKEANVAINIDAPANVPSGGEEVYKVTLQNNDSQKLVNLELEAIYPDGVSFESSQPNPENLSGTLFKVPELIPGQNAVVFIKAKVTGNINDQKTLNLKLHYHYSSFNSEFVKDGSFTVMILASDTTIELQGPTTTNNAQLVIYTLDYANTSNSDIQNARIKLTYPQGFVFAGATPPPDLGTDTWNITTLAKGGSGSIQIQGNFTSVNPGETKTATADFLVLGQDGQYFTQNTSSFNTSITSLPLLVSQVLEPANDSGVVNPGDTLTYDISYQNNAATVANGVNIEVDLNSKAIDLSSIRAEGGQVNNSSIIWNASTASQLASLTPNQSGQLSFTVRVKNPAIADNSKNLTIVSNIKITSNEYSSPFPGNQLTLKISSPATLAKSLTFLSGQLPPKVGAATTYNVKLSLTNSSNDFTDGVLTAFIPANGYLPNSVSGPEASNVQYDPSTGKLTWNFGVLPANTGRFSAPKTLSFQVKLIPSASQVNQSPTLVNQISFSAKDLFTNQPVTGSVSDVTTADINGNSGFGNGQVQN